MEIIDVIEELVVTASEGVIIKLVTPVSAERKAVEDFVLEEYYHRMGGVLASTPEIIFAAFEEGVVVGTMGLEFQELCGLMPCEHTFAFDVASLKFGLNRNRTAQYTRRIIRSDYKDGATLGPKLIAAVTQFALSQGKLYGFCELKPPLLRLTSKLGIELHEVKGSTILKDSVHPDVASFYLVEPYPKLYQIELVQVLEAITKRK